MGQGLWIETIRSLDGLRRHALMRLNRDLLLAPKHNLDGFARQAVQPEVDLNHGRPSLPVLHKKRLWNQSGHDADA
jgi:hypothetical protein